MPKHPGPIPAWLTDPTVSVAPDYDNEAIYFKLHATQFNTQNSKYGERLEGGPESGITKLYDALGPADRQYGQYKSVWWVDLTMWPHLIHPLCHCLKVEPNADNRIAMFWEPMQSIRTWRPKPPQAGGNGSDSPVLKYAGHVTQIGLMGASVLTIESAGRGQGIVVGQQLGKVLAGKVNAIYVDEHDPRHMATHWRLKLETSHLHLILPAGTSWQANIDLLARIACSKGFLGEADAEELKHALVGPGETPPPH